MITEAKFLGAAHGRSLTASFNLNHRLFRYYTIRSNNASWVAVLLDPSTQPPCKLGLCVTIKNPSTASLSLGVQDHLGNTVCTIGVDEIYDVYLCGTKKSPWLHGTSIGSSYVWEARKRVKLF